MAKAGMPSLVERFRKWRRPRQPHPGARIHRCRCFLPDLTGFTMYRRGGTDAAAIDRADGTETGELYFGQRDSPKIHARRQC